MESIVTSAEVRSGPSARIVHNITLYCITLCDLISLQTTMSVQFVRRLKPGMIVYFSFLTSPESSTGGVLEFQSLSHRYTATREVTVTERTRTRTLTPVGFLGISRLPKVGILVSHEH